MRPSVLSPRAQLLAITIAGVVASLLCSSSLAHAQSVQTQSAQTQSAQTPATASANGVEATVVPRGMRRVTWPTTKRVLATGDTVHAEDIALLDTTIVWPWNSMPDTTRAVAGWIVRRPVAVGEVLRTPSIMAPPVVSAGAAVTAIWQDGSLRLVLTGVAMNTASLGAPVGVRIDRTRRLDGVAVAPNTVRLR